MQENREMRTEEAQKFADKLFEEKRRRRLKVTAATKVEKWACSSCHKEYYVEAHAEDCCTGFSCSRCPECESMLKITRSKKYTDYSCQCGWSGRSS